MGLLMKRLIPVCVAVLVAAATISVATPSYADRGGTNRPFFAVGSFVCPSPTSDCQGGSGWATHLGRFTMANDESLLTASNGDQLASALDWSTIDYTPPPGGAPCTPDEFRVRFTANFTGGTGRFAHASGTYTWTACSSDEIHYRFFDVGTINY
jgi:hypothetical protein